jgi:hypothetical protein
MMSHLEVMCVAALAVSTIFLAAIHAALFRMVRAMEDYIGDARTRLECKSVAEKDGLVETETLPLGLHHPTEELKNEYLIQKMPLLPVDKRSPYDDWNWGIKEDDVDGE